MCRTINGLDVNAIDDFKKNITKIINGEFDNLSDIVSMCQKDGRGNICPVTIILPTLAMECKLKVEKRHSDENGDMEDVPTEQFEDEVVKEFLTKMLPKKLDEAKDMLNERFEHICSQSPDSAKFMWENHTMAGYFPEEGVISAMRHGTLAIGQLGLAEALQILIGKDQTTSEGMKLAKQIEQLYADKCAEYKKQYKLNYGVYFTPKHKLSVGAYTVMYNEKVA